MFAQQGERAKDEKGKEKEEEREREKKEKEEERSGVGKERAGSEVRFPIRKAKSC
jgi:hypothetical protein